MNNVWSPKLYEIFCIFNPCFLIYIDQICRIFFKILVTKHYNLTLSWSTMFGTMFGDQKFVIASSERGRGSGLSLKKKYKGTIPFESIWHPL